MPLQVGRPQLPKSTNEKLNARRKYYREYNRKRHIQLLKSAEEMKKKFNKCEKKSKEIIDEYDKAIKKVQQRKNQIF